MTAVPALAVEDLSVEFRTRSGIVKVLEHVGPAGFMECFSHYVRTPTLDLARIAVPALVLAGEADPGASPSGNAALAAALPAARLELLPQCGHFCMIEHPDLVERAVRNFLVTMPQPVLRF